MAGDHPDASPDAVAFAEKLRLAIHQELKVQERENGMPLAKADPSTLSGYKAKRAVRIRRDAKFKKQLGRKLPLYALATPTPAAGVLVSAPDLALLERLKRAHESTRRVNKLTQWQASNTAFVKSGEWARRDRAVQLRDEVIEVESAFMRLVDQAIDIAAGSGTKQMRNSMIRTLDEVSPTSRDDSADYVKLTLNNPDVRTQVLTEVLTVLGSMAPKTAPPRPESVLGDEVQMARASLIAQSGLAETVTSFIEIERKRNNLQNKLDTNGKLDPADRHTMTLQRKELDRELARLRQVWRATEPDTEKAFEAIALYNELIERRMLDIGYRAAAFVRRHDTIQTYEDRARRGKANVWGVLEQQQALLALLDDARPEVSPLQGLDAPPTPAEIKAIKTLKAQVQQAINKAVAKSKINLGGKGGKGGKKKKAPKKKKGKGKNPFGGLFDDR